MDWTGLFFGRFFGLFFGPFLGPFFGPFYKGRGTPLVLGEGWVQSTSTEGGVGEDCHYSRRGGRWL